MLLSTFMLSYMLQSKNYSCRLKKDFCTIDVNQIILGQTEKEDQIRLRGKLGYNNKEK